MAMAKSERDAQIVISVLLIKDSRRYLSSYNTISMSVICLGRSRLSLFL
jgi:hypothetical protein